MSDDLDAVIREMWPGLRPGERLLDGERQYSAAWLDDRRPQAVPDKEEQVSETLPPGIYRDKENGTLYGVTKGSGDLVTVSTPPPSAMPFSDALAAFAETVGDAGHINADVHGLPIQFFGRDDIENVDVLVSQGRVLITGQLVIGGHKFLCFSEGFPMGAE